MKKTLNLLKFTNYESLNLVLNQDVDKDKCVTVVLNDVVVVLPLAPAETVLTGERMVLNANSILVRLTNR